MQPRAVPAPDEIVRRILRGEERALSRLLSGLEDGESWSGESLRLLRNKGQDADLDSAERSSAGERSSPERSSPERSSPERSSPERSSPERSSPAHIIGLTGPPGSGKSTLADKLIQVYRKRGVRVAVLAVDPSSPFTGGAILGDRIRMQGGPQGASADGFRGRSGVDDGLFIRSLASRGRLGGLSRASGQCARALEAAGYGVVIVETVGIGQSEVDIVRLADSVVLVTMPGGGDDIQTIKAGVMEIGDVFVVNKADREGADRAVREIEAMLETGLASRGAVDRSAMDHREYAEAAQRERSAAAQNLELPPVLKTTAATGEGVAALVAALDSRWATLLATGGLEARRRRGAIAEARALLSERVLAELESLEAGLEDTLADDIVRGEREAAQAAEILFNAIRADPRGRQGDSK